jgi:hypothetical protein
MYEYINYSKDKVRGIGEMSIFPQPVVCCSHEVAQRIRINEHPKRETQKREC